MGVPEVWSQELYVVFALLAFEAAGKGILTPTSPSKMLPFWPPCSPRPNLRLLHRLLDVDLVRQIGGRQGHAGIGNWGFISLPTAAAPDGFELAGRPGA